MRLGIHKDWVLPGERTPLIDVTALMGLTTTTAQLYRMPPSTSYIYIFPSIPPPLTDMKAIARMPIHKRTVPVLPVHKKTIKTTFQYKYTSKTFLSSPLYSALNFFDKSFLFYPLLLSLSLSIYLVNGESWNFYK